MRKMKWLHGGTRMTFPNAAWRDKFDKSPTDKTIDDLILVRSIRSVCNRFAAAARSGNSGGRRSSVTPTATATAKCWRTPPATRSTTFPEPALALWSSDGQEVVYTSIKTRVGARYSWVFRAIRFYEGKTLPDHARSFIVGTFRGMRCRYLDSFQAARHGIRGRPHRIRQDHDALLSSRGACTEIYPRWADIRRWDAASTEARELAYVRTHARTPFIFPRFFFTTLNYTPLLLFFSLARETSR